MQCSCEDFIINISSRLCYVIVLCTNCCTHCTWQLNPALRICIFIQMPEPVYLGELLVQFVSVVLIRNCEQLAEDSQGRVGHTSESRLQVQDRIDMLLAACLAPQTESHSELRQILLSSLFTYKYFQNEVGLPH